MNNKQIALMVIAFCCCYSLRSLRLIVDLDSYNENDQYKGRSTAIIQQPSNTTKKQTEGTQRVGTDIKHHHDYLLSVPFYIYEEEFLRDENLLNFTDMYHQHLKESRSPVSVSVANESHVTFEEYLELRGDFKHAGDLHFVRAALEHPSRVLNPEDAKIFVVPSLLVDYTFRVHYFPEQLKRDAFSHLKRMDAFLNNSVWFKKSNGANHIALNVLMRGGWILERAKFLPRCNVIQFEESGIVSKERPIISKEVMHNRTMFKVFYVGKPCNSTAIEEKSHDFTFVGTMHKHKHGLNKHFEDRRNMCEWLLNRTNRTVTVCGRAKSSHCPHLSQSWFGFHARGDTKSANRLFDTLLSGTVPVFTLKEHYHCQPDWYKWDILSYFADVRNETKFLEDIDNMTKNKTDIIIKTQNVRDNMDLFNWKTNVPFDIYMVSVTSTKMRSTERSFIIFELGGVILLCGTPRAC